MLRTSVYVCSAFLDIFYTHTYISAYLSDYRIFKSPNICISIVLKNSLSVRLYIIPDKLDLSGHLEQLLVQTLLSGNWCPSRLSIRTGSVLLYTRSLGSAVSSHGLSDHCYADDTQLFLSFPSSSSNTHVVTLISECLQTSPLGQLLITSNSSLINLNSSSSWEQTALTWTCQSLSSMLWYHLHRLRGTWA